MECEKIHPASKNKVPNASKGDGEGEGKDELPKGFNIKRKELWGWKEERGGQ